MRQVAGVKDECRRFRISLDSRYRRAESSRDIGVRWFVEPNMSVADLNEAECATLVRHHRCTGRLAKWQPLQNATGQSPNCTGAHPGHAFQEMPSVQIVLVVYVSHTYLFYKCKKSMPVNWLLQHRV